MSYSWETREKSKGIVNQLRDTFLIASIKCSYDVICIMENISRTTQRSDVSAQEANFVINLAKQRFKEMCCNDEASKIWSHAEKLQAELGDEMTDSIMERKEKRKRKLPEILSEMTDLPDIDTPDTTFQSFSQKYFDLINLIDGAMQRRFSQNDLKILEDIEIALIDSVNGKLEKESFDKIFPIVSRVMKLQQSRKAEFEEELKGLPVLLKMRNEQIKPRIKTVTKISTICDIFNAMPMTKKACKITHDLLKYYCTVPMSSATAERSFSAMRRLKTWTRAKTGPNHLNNILFAVLHKDYMDDVNIHTVADEFIKFNEKRLSYFGHF